MASLWRLRRSHSLWESEEHQDELETSLLGLFLPVGSDLGGPCQEDLFVLERSRWDRNSRVKKDSLDGLLDALEGHLHSSRESVQLLGESGEVRVEEETGRQDGRYGALERG